MKYLSNYSYLITGISLVFALGSCVKDRNDLATDFSNIQPIVEIRDNISGVGNDAGLANFGKAALNLSADHPDTVSFYVNLASVNVMNHDISVTLAIDDAARVAYNADALAADPNAVQYEPLPDSVFSFTQTQTTIPAGLRVGMVSVVFDKSKIPDPVKSYMLPITITDASGLTISGNFATIYYHVIGNPLAGNYLQDFYRWNDVADTTGPPNSTVFEGQPIPISPESSTTLALPESYLQTFTGGFISLSFTNDNGVLSDFSASLNDATKKGLDDQAFVVKTAPVLVYYKIVGDASTHYAGSVFRTYMEVVNSSGGNRKLVDQFTKQ